MAAAETLGGLRVVEPRPSQGLSRYPWGLAVFGVVLAVLVASPLLALAYGALMNAAPGQPGTLSVNAFVEAWSDPASWTAAATSLGLAVARLLVVMPLTVFLAWALTRTNMPFRRLMEGLIISHIFLPFLPLAMSWAVLASPRSGVLNVLLRSVLHLPLESGPLNIYSVAGLVWLSGLGIPTYLYLLIGPAFRTVDASLEEAARVAGCGPLATLRRVTLPLLAPAILGAAILAFVLALQSFEPELILGAPAGIYVFSTQIFRYIEGFTVPRYGPATALSGLFLVVTFALVALQGRLLARRHFMTLSGRGYRVQPMDLGRWRYAVLGLVAVYVFLSTLLPLATLALASFMRIYGLFGEGWFTTRHYEALFANARLGLAVGNTILMAALSAALTLVLTLITSYVITRTRLVGRRALDAITWLPLTMPGIVLAVGMIWAYVALLRLPFPFYGTLAILVLAVTITALPTGARVLNGTMVQIGAELEESARVHGGSFLFTLRRVVLPLLTPALLSGWLVLFAFATKNFVTVSLLYSPQSIVLPALQYEMWTGGQAEDAAALGTLNMAFSFLLVLAYSLLTRRRSPS
jgi:iron(III) transport system permease protein